MKIFRHLLLGTALVAAVHNGLIAETEHADIKSEITKRHDEAVKRLQDWIAQVSIAAENRGYPEGAEYMAKLARDAGFQQRDGDQHRWQARRVRDARRRCAENGRAVFHVRCETVRSSRVVVAADRSADRGQTATWQSDDRSRRGEPEGTGSGVPRGPARNSRRRQEDAGQPGARWPKAKRRSARRTSSNSSRTGRYRDALKKCVGVFMPFAAQDLDGIVTVNLGSKGVIELELVSSGEKWGRGPAKDIHSSLKAMVDSPAWHLVKALNTLVSDDGNVIMIDNYPKPLPPTAEEKAMIEKVSKTRSEAQAKKQFTVQHWINDLPWEQANERLESQPTVNIEGLVGGYTGPGGKTVLPHRAVAKIDMRLVPDMKAADALAALKAHLAKRGFGDIEVNMTGGYDPTATSKDSALIQAQLATYKNFGIDALLWPRNAGSYPGYVFTGEPLKLAAGHFGLGHGSGAHAPDEYYIIESTNPKIQGFDGAVMSFVEYLYELAK